MREIEFKKTGKANACDLMLFADSRQKIGGLICATSGFMSYAHIEFNLAKCRIIKYNPSK
jgi:hypothetical protein